MLLRSVFTQLVDVYLKRRKPHPSSDSLFGCLNLAPRLSLTPRSPGGSWRSPWQQAVALLNFPQRLPVLRSVCVAPAVCKRCDANARAEPDGCPDASRRGSEEKASAATERGAEQCQEAHSKGRYMCLHLLALNLASPKRAKCYSVLLSP